MRAEQYFNEFKQKNTTGPPRKKQISEIGVFLLFFAFTVIVSSIIVRKTGMSFVPVAISVILQNVLLVGLIFYLIRRNGEPLSSIGWTLKDIKENIILGIVLFVPFFYGVGILSSALSELGLSAPATPVPSFLIPSGASELLLAFILVLVVALSEEIIFRGYLILRFQSITNSLTAALLLSSVPFSLGHLYEGEAGVATTFFIGIILALIYIRQQSLIAPVVIHFLQNFTGIALAVLLRTNGT